jgi:hypothetical protein
MDLISLRQRPGPGCRAFTLPPLISLVPRQIDRHCGPPTAWHALFGRVRAAHVRVETTYRRLVTGERMAVLCHGSND